MMFEQRVQALEPLGFTPRQTRFLALVALHSGYCLRRQYAAFAGVRYGKNVCDFLETLVERGLAERFTQRADRGLIYHLHARTVYRAVGERDNRNRREASAALIARKIMMLDYVLRHADLEWLATEADKVTTFAARYGVPPNELPQRVFAASHGGDVTTRHFIHKSPVAVAGDPPVAHFACLVTDTTGRGLEQFIHDHRRLFAWLPAWTVIAVGPSPVGLLACESTFQRGLLDEPGSKITPAIMRGCSMEPGEVRRDNRAFAIRGSSCALGLSSPLRSRPDRVLRTECLGEESSRSDDRAGGRWHQWLEHVRAAARAVDRRWRRSCPWP
jgi:hypothetical protein